MKRTRSTPFAAAMIVTLAVSSVFAGPDPIPLSAEQAFEAVTTGIDPITGAEYGKGKIVIVDVRTPPEYQFQGTAGKVDNIVLKNADSPIVPDLGKATMSHDGRFLLYSVRSKKKKTPIIEIAKLETSSIAINIPCATYNQQTKMMDPSPEIFAQGIEDLAKDGVQALITMCNSGGRSTACIAKFVSDELASRFKAIYEIDRAGDQYLHPEHKIHLAGLGGFQGSAYRGIYNGSAGYPDRRAASQPVQGWKDGMPNGPSVSWRDSGLPIYIPETSCNLPDVAPTP